MNAVPSFIAKRAVRKICCEVFGRALIGFALCVPVAIWLGLCDELRLGLMIAMLGAVSIGIAIGASLVERKVS